MTGRTTHLTTLVLAAALLACVLALLSAPGEAEASFPGKNGKIAFSAYEDEPGDKHVLFSVDPDGSDKTRLTDRNGPNWDGSEDSEPDWSPDGTRLAFWNHDDDWSDPSGHINVMGADGSGQSRIVFSPPPYFGPENDPSWSADGRKIAFAAWEDDDGLCQPEYEGEEVDENTPGCQDGDTEIYVTSPDGADPTQITDNGSTDNEGDPAWSPDGRKIAFVRDDVWVMSPDGSGEERLTNSPDFRELAPDWSPDGSRIAFVRGRDVWVMAADGTDQRKLTDLPGEHLGARGVSWSPDGRKIAFGSNGRSGVYVMGADGSDPTPIAAPGYDPDWGTHPTSPPPDEAKPTITRPRPAPGSALTHRAPTLGVLVRDEGDEMAKSNMRLFLDGHAKVFSYDPDTDRLSRATKRLSYGWHRVRVEAVDGSGNGTKRAWSFRVTRR